MSLSLGRMSQTEPSPAPTLAFKQRHLNTPRVFGPEAASRRRLTRFLGVDLVDGAGGSKPGRVEGTQLQQVVRVGLQALQLQLRLRGRQLDPVGQGLVVMVLPPVPDLEV